MQTIVVDCDRDNLPAEIVVVPERNYAIVRNRANTPPTYRPNDAVFCCTFSLQTMLPIADQTIIMQRVFGTHNPAKVVVRQEITAICLRKLEAALANHPEVGRAILRRNLARDIESARNDVRAQDEMRTTHQRLFEQATAKLDELVSRAAALEAQ